MAANPSQAAYQLKSIRYNGESKRILLQNSNGPCPLLAAANALLLRGVVTLDASCVRSGVAGTDDVVHLLADRALTAGTRDEFERWAAAGEGRTVVAAADPSQREYHLNEVLSILPNLQHGMDVNPRFSSGPAGVEYTTNLAAFDLLGVELVHGWLLDPQDKETAAVVGNRTYNQLVEVVIRGSEAREEAQRLEERLLEGQRMLEEGGVADTGSRDSGIGEEGGGGDKEGDESGFVLVEGTNASVASTNSTQTEKRLKEDGRVALEKEIADMSERMSDLSLQITHAAVANAFLASSSHQLTHHGLERLLSHVAEGALCVFFRNNHFATLTRRGGVLYLLVTDLGYANTPEIVWEKLDNIDGDTEYVNESFTKPAPREELTPAAGPTIAPELLLAQRGQSESDYQLALALSKGAAATPGGPDRLDDEEGRLVEAAKELSLKTYHGDGDAEVRVGTVADVGGSPRIHSDLEVAMAQQQERQRQEHQSEQLARQLQELEYARGRPAGVAVGGARRPARPARAQAAASSTGCVVS